MSDILPRRLVVVPGAVEREDAAPVTPEQAVGRVLGANPHAPGLLSQARHRVLVARNSVAAAIQAARACRHAEVGYEQARRAHDPGEARNLHFWPAVAILAALAVVAAAVTVVMAWHLPWLVRIVLALGAVILGAAVAGGASRRRDAAAPFALAGLAMCAILVAVSVLWSAGSLLPRLGEAMAFGVALAAAGVAAVLVRERAEGWCCYRPRRAFAEADRRRQRLAGQVSRDEAAAEAAVGAWVSLVVEECQLGPAADAGGPSWVDACAEAARKVAIPR